MLLDAPRFGDQNLRLLRQTQAAGAAFNYANTLFAMQRFEEAKAVLRKMTPVARHVLGEGHELLLRMRWRYAESLRDDPAATLDDLREAVETYEDAGRTARLVLGGAHPVTVGIETDVQDARSKLDAREA